MNRAIVALLLSLALGVAGCVRGIDRTLVGRPIAETLRLPDPDLACRSANANATMVRALGHKYKSWRSMVILDTTSAVCAQQQAMEADLEAAHARFWLEGEERLAAVTDAQIRGRRAHTLAAARQARAFGVLDRAVGPIGEDCPTLRKDQDRLAWFIGVIAGGSAVLEDQAGGGRNGVSLDTLNRAARGAACLDDEAFWYVPSALEAGVWVMVPGTGPEGVDPFEAMDEAARKGEEKGLHLARALQIVVAANAGREDVVKDALEAFTKETPDPPADVVLLEEYARMLALHQQDLVWMRERGYRAAALGEVPRDDESGAPGSSGDPFAGDPFADDPFADESDPFADDADDQGGSDGEGPNDPENP